MSTLSATAALPANIKDINGGDPTIAAAASAKASSISTLDQGDFLRLLTVQLQQQDPLAPVDNKDMLAQIAQFSALAGSAETNATLTDISTKLDALIEAQRAAIPAKS
ncbi:flagellar hook assembly protein FlgD [Aurantiacibacter zhengii]|mgnify:CR=1 FL=1|uniref:Basal-body rod modification protein FlgD n=1 Tax=Aurantiacibacter zhengii TaxID=2307003 RepID=A0A418NS61_9SPHN|nr:flagellar hook capping FlgD N-terminal domain-containing protein [Aurantiacibacter zhengii]RIV85775.1 flagellar biosynthesis protein FlgD [Aurantiacibacter zhengii]